MKALPYSVKAWIQAPNSKGLSPIGIRYTVNGKPNSAALGISVPADKWQKKEGLVSTRFDNHQQVNAVIRLRCQQMTQAAASASSKEWQSVRPLYEQLVAEYDKQAYNTEFNRKVDYVEDLTDAMLFTEAKAKAEATIKEATVKLRELAKKGIVEETDQTREFDNMLLAYPAKFIVKGTGTKVKQQIDSFIERLKAFSKAEGYALTFDSMNSNFYELFGLWLMYKRNKNCYNNYFGANIKKLKTFLRWCESQGKQVNPQYRDFKVLTEEKEIVYLDNKEINLLDEFRDHIACKDAWIKYIDFTLFQCLTGLRYSDVAASKWKVDKGFLKGTAKKNKGSFKIPMILDQRIEQLLKKYPDGFKLFAEQNYNDEIKKITAKLFEVHNINQKKIKIYKYKLEDEFESKHYKHELLSSHSNRRSFCTRAIEAGFTEKEVLSIIGSKSMIELRRYVKVEDDNLLAKAQRLSSN